jgi:Tol biopolymer transport system component
VDGKKAISRRDGVTLFVTTGGAEAAVSPAVELSFRIGGKWRMVENGSRLGSYEILGPLGEGGMGEVYEARDPSLDRKVAIKLLPADLAEDPQRQARFEREAKTIASLNHPNIVTIHSVEEAGGVHFLTMELVDGRPLSQLIPRKGLPLSRFLELATPLAEAISAAHEAGITHRDIKPENVMVSESGRLKVLDFGLAKQAVPEADLRAGSGSNAETLAMTEEGRILGTIAYMSPEQAEGRMVDPRSDIFSLGIIFYEMATGERPFQGETKISLISSILRDTPRSVNEINQALPRHLGRIIKHCLAKDPGRRYQSAVDLRNDLEELKREVDSGETLATGTISDIVAVRRSAWFRVATGALAAAGVVVVVLAVVGLIALVGNGKPGTGGTNPFTGASFTQLTQFPGQEVFPSLSPDGNFIVYAAKETKNWDIMLLRVGGTNPINLTTDMAADDTQPVYSPDGKQIAFRSERDNGGIFIMGATGESVRRVTDFGFNPAWSPDGTQLLLTTERVEDPNARWTASLVFAVSLETGEVRNLTNADAVQAAWSPGGTRIAFWGLTGAGKRDISTIPASGGDPVRITDDDAVDWNPVWSPDGSHLYFTSNRGGAMNIWRVAVDEDTGETLGSPEPVTSGVSATAQQFSFSADGKHLAYVSQIQSANIQRLPFDPESGQVVGETEWVTRGSGLTWFPNISPDGRRLVYGSRGPQEDLFVTLAGGSSPRRLTNDPYNDRMPRWSPDGKKILFYSNRTGSYELWTIKPDGSGLTQITEEPGVTQDSPIWSPDGTRIVYTALGVRPFVISTDKPWVEQTPTALPLYSEQGDSFITWSWSPDGRKLAGTIVSSYGKPSGVAVYSFDTGEYTQVNSFGGHPVWLSDSSRILFSDWQTLYLLDTVNDACQIVYSVEPDDLYGFFDLSADDEWIYIARTKTESDIWMMSVQ